MGLRWHLVEYLDGHGITWPALEERLGFTVGADLKGASPPIDLSLPIVADLCQALACQPGDLLTWVPDDASEQAERALAMDQSFQSFLAFKQARDEG